MVDLGAEDNNIKMDDKRLTGKYVQNIILQRGPVAGSNEYGNRPAIKKAGNILSVRRILKDLVTLQPCQRSGNGRKYDVSPWSKTC